MRRSFPLIVLCAAVAVCVGCASGERKAGKLLAAEQSAKAVGRGQGIGGMAALPPEPVRRGPALDSDPETWVKGELFQVWPYRNGEVAGYLGTRHGLNKGDVLVLSRDGVMINTVIVIDVHRETFFGRVTDRGPGAVRPQVGDIAIRGPQPMMPKPVISPEDTKTAGKK